MNERISQSLAGRTSINHLSPFDVSEIGLRETVFDTIYTGYMKNLTSFPVRGLGVEKHVIYTGDKSLTIGDVEITGWNGLIKLLAQLSEK